MTSPIKYPARLIFPVALFLFASNQTQAQTAPDSLPPSPSSISAPAGSSSSAGSGIDGASQAPSGASMELPEAVKNVKVDIEERDKLYLKVDNPITIHTSGAPEEEIICRMRGEGTSIEKRAADQYVIRVSRPGLVVLDVIRVKDSSEYYLSGRAMEVKPLPRPVAQYAGKSSGSITKKELMKGKVLSTDFKLPFDLSAPVESFLLTIVLPEKAGTPTWKVKGAEVPDVAKKGLKDAPVGSVVFFDEIMVKMPGEDAPKMITGLVLRITE